VGGDDPAIAQPIPLDGSVEAYEHIEAGAFESGGSDGYEGEHDTPDDANDLTGDSDAAQPDVAVVAEIDDEASDGPELETPAEAPVDDEVPEMDYDNLLEAGLTTAADADIESWDGDDEDSAAATRDIDVEDELAQLDAAVASDMADEAADAPMAVDEPDAELDAEAAELDAEDDAGEDGPGEDGSGDTPGADDESDIAWDEFSAQRYVRASTAEHAGLAEAMARAATEETEQIAISASMPGVESGLVGLEDVVAASGEDVDTIIPRAKSDLPIRVATGLLLIGAFFASLLWRPAIGLFVIAVIAIAAAEFYTVLTNSGHNPLTLFGLAGVIGAMLGTWAWGPVAIPATIAVTLVASLIYYGIVVGRRDPLANLALTVMGVGWIGGAGALVFELINAVEYQWLMVALVVTVALSDVAQYFTGRNFGKRPLAPVVSPKKTVEGLVGGILVALLFGAALSLMDAFSLQEGLITGAIVAVFAPIGDLAVSVVKRTIGIKDMGVILPGHGGVLDRIDAMIFTVPALWVAWSWLGLLA
jgi:phosphatidate cytidylyltransferase